MDGRTQDLTSFHCQTCCTVCDTAGHCTPPSFRGLSTPTLHFQCVTTGGVIPLRRVQVRKSWSLKHLARVEAFPSSRPDGRPLAVEFQFGGNAFSNEAKLACEAHTPSELMDLMGTLYLFAK